MAVVSLRAAERIAVESPTGLERITRLETKFEDLVRRIDIMDANVTVVRDLLVAGRGAMRLVHFIFWAFGVAGAGYVFRDKAIWFLKWIGS